MLTPSFPPALYAPAIAAAPRNAAAATLRRRDAAADTANTAAARAYLAQALELGKGEPTESRALQSLRAAVISHYVGDQAAARDYFEKAKTLFGDMGAGSLLTTLQSIGEYDKAFAYASEKGGGDDPGVLHNIVKNMIDNKNPDAKTKVALEVAASAKQTTPIDRGYASYAAAQDLVGVGDKTAAAALLAKSSVEVGGVEDAMGLGQAINLLCLTSGVQKAAGDLPGARQSLERALALNAKSPYVESEIGTDYYRIAACYREIGDTAKAAELCAKATPMIEKIQADGNEGKALTVALKNQALAGQVSEAIARAEKAEYDVSAFDRLSNIFDALYEKDPAGARLVLASFEKAAAAEPVLRYRVFKTTFVVDRLHNLGDDARAKAVLETFNQQIAEVPEKEFQPRLRTTYLQKMAILDPQSAAKQADKIDATDPDMKSDLLLDLATASAKAVWDAHHPVAVPAD